MPVPRDASGDELAELLPQVVRHVVVQSVVQEHNLLLVGLLVQYGVHVARVGVSVDPPRAENHLGEEVRKHAADLVRVHPSLSERLRVIRRHHARHELHRENPLRRVLPEDFRDFGVRLVSEVLAGELGVPPLDGEVQLRADGDLEVVHNPREVEAPGFDLLAEHPENGEVGRHLLQETRVLNLDRYLRAVLQDRPVNLGERCRGEGLVVHALEYLVEALHPKVLLDHVLHLGEGAERRLVADYL
mmetsp:Transcript_10564/g.29860  ORF Transcript_10564/g.29860 Transcript_10564/m.29860 type:complete len:245 (-) Transcript_10564:377-1111(-)